MISHSNMDHIKRARQLLCSCSGVNVHVQRALCLLPAVDIAGVLGEI